MKTSEITATIPKLIAPGAKLRPGTVTITAAPDGDGTLWDYRPIPRITTAAFKSPSALLGFGIVVTAAILSGFRAGWWRGVAPNLIGIAIGFAVVWVVVRLITHRRAPDAIGAVMAVSRGNVRDFAVVPFGIEVRIALESHVPKTWLTKPANSDIVVTLMPKQPADVEAFVTLFEQAHSAAWRAPE